MVSDESRGLSSGGAQVSEAGVAGLDDPGPDRPVREVQDPLTGMTCDSRGDLEQAVAQTLGLPPPSGLVGPVNSSV